MAKPTSKAELKDYCLRRLGFPVIDINVDDDQVDDRVDDALQLFHEFNFDGLSREYLAVKIKVGDAANTFVSLPTDVVGVTRIFRINSETTNSNGSNFNMFDLNYQLRLNELYDFTSSSYIYYWIARTHIEMLDQILIGQNPIRFNKKMNRLYVDMNWANDEIPVDEYMMVECTRELDADTYTKIYNDEWLKEYTTQIIKKQWGENMKKYSNYTLPGGMIINGQQIYDEAVAEIAKLEIKLRDTYEEPPEFLVG